MENKTLILIAILFAMIGIVGAGIQYLDNVVLDNPHLNSSIYDFPSTNLCGIRNYNVWYYADKNIYLEISTTYANNDLVNPQSFSQQIDINIDNSGIGVIQMSVSGYRPVPPDSNDAIANSVMITKGSYYYIENAVTSPDLVPTCINWREFEILK